MMLFSVAISIILLAIFTDVAAPHPSPQRTGRALPIRKRSILVNADNSVNFDELQSHITLLQAKVHRGFDNFQRNTGVQHPSFVKQTDSQVAKFKRGTPEPMTYLNDMWFGEIAVGTPNNLPEHVYTVQFDTGSTDLFIPHVNCDQSCRGHFRWNPAVSTTSNDLDQKFSFQYDNDGTVSGNQYTDDVMVAGLTATDQTFGAALSYPASLKFPTPFIADGVMGMAYEPLSNYGAPGVFDTLVRESQLTTNIFSFKFSDIGSELYIDGMNTQLYIGNFSYVNVTTVAFWEVILDSIEVNGRTLMNNINGIIDTGSAVIMGHSSDVSTLYSVMGGTPAPQGSGYYILPCNSIPTVNFTFAGVSFPISPSALNLGQVSPGSSDCLGGIVGADMGASFWVIGRVFLQNVYTTFDFAYSSVGFAHLA